MFDDINASYLLKSGKLFERFLHLELLFFFQIGIDFLSRAPVSLKQHLHRASLVERRLLLIFKGYFL